MNIDNNDFADVVPWRPDEPSPTYTDRNVHGPRHIAKILEENPLKVKKKAGSKALLVRLSDVEPEPISWLWEGRIALGKLTIVSGDPGLGKSLLTATIAATVSKGGIWPVDRSRSPIGDVVFLSAEDDPADTIRPRLDAAGADSTRIHVLKAICETNNDGTEIERNFSFKRDMAALEKMLKGLPECRLLIIDPVSAYLDGTDSNNNSDIRGLFAPLTMFAAKHKIAVLTISHLNKGSGGSALYRTMGSLAFTAAARAAFVVAKDQDRPTRRLMLPLKNNIATECPGLAYSIITAENGAPVLVWEQESVDISAADALVIPEAIESHADSDWETMFLMDLLASGPKSVVEVQREARAQGITEKQLRRAREKLGIKPKKTGFGGGWVWSLLDHEDAQTSEHAHSQSVGSLGDAGQLGDHLQDDFSSHEY